MEREKIKKCLILGPLIKDLHNLDEEEFQSKYVEAMENFERNCEKSLIETFAKLDIKASVKTDPYSLPFNNEVVVELKGESYMNGPYEFYRVAREIVKEVLNKDIYKIRFYLFINAVEYGFLGKIQYKFRYHIPDYFKDIDTSFLEKKF